MDSRVRRVMQALARHPSPKIAAELFNPTECPSSVTGAQLMIARRNGWVDYERVKQGVRMWRMTEAGRLALHDVESLN